MDDHHPKGFRMHLLSDEDAQAWYDKIRADLDAEAHIIGAHHGWNSPLGIAHRHLHYDLKALAEALGVGGAQTDSGGTDKPPPPPR